MRVTSVTHDPDEIALLFIFATASVASSAPAPSRRIFIFEEDVMSQNLLSLQFTSAQLADVDAALAALENALAGLVSLTADQRRSLVRMGPKSEPFCRQTTTVLAQNPQVIPLSLSLAEAQSDLAALDALRPRLTRL